MARTLTSGMQAAVAAEVATYCHLLEFQFVDSGNNPQTVRITTAARDIVTTTPAAAWTAAGGVLQFEVVTEGTDLSGYGLQITLGDVSGTILAALLTGRYLGRVCKVYLCHLEADGTVTADPVLIFRGRMNGGFEVTENRPQDGGLGTVTVTTRAVDELGDFDQRRGIWTSLETHQSVFPGDTFFSFVPSMVGRRLYWGKAGNGTWVNTPRRQAHS